MSEQPAPSLELVRREASEALERPLPYMSDGEVAAAYRTAKALADSGLFKDSRQPGQAFAKMLAGRDLGLTPFESMSALHVIEGKIEAGADLHATRVRSREGYDYRVWWLRVADEWDGKPDDRGRLRPPSDLVEAVASEDEDPVDLRDYFGCVIEFTVNGKRRGVARWTLEDSRVSGLLAKAGPGGGPGNHVKFPRSMYFARAMSQGVSLHVPEVMGGLRVYAPGELSRESGEDVGAGASGPAPVMDNLPTAVEAVVARARELGHASLSDRAHAAAAITGLPAEGVTQWCARQTRELNAHAARKRRGEPEPVPEPPDAEVVRCGAPDSCRVGVTCELDPGHAGAHLAAGQSWDSFLENCGVEFGAGVDGDPRPARCTLAKGHAGDHTGPMVTPPDDVQPESPAETTDPVRGPEVVDTPETQNEPLSAPEDPQAPDTTPAPADAPETPAEPHEAHESGEVVDGEVTAADAERAEHLRGIATQLLEDADAADSEGKPDEAERLRASAAETMAEADALGDPSQPGFEF